MSSFVRGSSVLCSATFAPTDGSNAAPANAEAILVYTDLTGLQATATIPLTLASDGVTWTGNWDSTAAQEGEVEWAVRCWNGLVAAAQGMFMVLANKASMV